MKKMNKWADGEWLFILVAVGILAWWLYSSQSTNLADYLGQNAAVISIDQSQWDDLALLERDLVGKEIILTGQNEGVKGNVELDFKFLQYLKEKTPLKYYLCEISYTEAKVINQYLQTGDEEALKEFLHTQQVSSNGIEESYKRWQRLYAYNQSLEPGDKLQVVGIDIERQIDKATRYLQALLPSTQAPKAISESIKRIKEEDKLSSEWANILVQDRIANEPMYRDYLGEAYLDFEIVMDNIANTYEAYAQKDHFDNLKNKMMYENFLRLYDILPKGVYYGQWGINHIFQKEQNDTLWLAGHLESGRFEDKVLSIAYAYENCEKITQATRLSYGRKLFSSLADRYNLLKGLPSDESLLLRLVGEDSPFEKKLIWPISHDGGGDTPWQGVSTDYFQYLVIVRGFKTPTSL